MTLFNDKYRIETTRLHGWNYTNGWYFVTICTQGREPFFGTVEQGDVRLSPLGDVACNIWQTIPQHTSCSVVVELDEFIVMPNHVHGIIIMNQIEPLHTTNRRDENNRMSKISPQSDSLGVLIRSYKSAVSRWCKKNGYPAFAWQSRYYDHIIRDEQALLRIRQYIANNPVQWDIDQENPASLWM